MEADSPVWGRLHGEPSPWYSRFCEYRAQGVPRSVTATYRTMLEQQGASRRGTKPIERVATIPNSWQHAKERYKWTERVAAWDRHQQEQRAREANRRGEEDAELRIAAELRAKAMELLRLPVTLERVKYNRNGQGIEVVVAVEFRAFVVACALFREAMTHARTALEMPSRFERQEVTGRDGGAVDITQVSDAPDERLVRLRALAQHVAEGRTEETAESRS